jgi:hypothetical protein
VASDIHGADTDATKFPIGDHAAQAGLIGVDQLARPPDPAPEGRHGNTHQHQSAKNVHDQ